MDAQLLASWQVHPQDSQPPQQAYTPPQSLNYTHIPFGPSLTGVVYWNDQNPSFAEKFPTINRWSVHCQAAISTLISRDIGIQHILSSGQYQQYLYYSDQASIEADIENFYQESVGFVHDQHQALQDDLPILQAYDFDIRDLELKLMANEARETSAISFAVGHQMSEKACDINKSMLLLMRSRSALLRQDLAIRRDLVHVETAITNFTNVVVPLQLRVKYNMMSMMTGVQDESVVREEVHQVLKGLLPWDTLREQRREQLQRCREARAGLEKRLGEAKAHLQVLESARDVVSDEHV